MRIIGGIAGGFILKAPKGFEVRPTPDLVRQALFNSLGERVNAATVLDLFSGTGAIGLECLSRGARRVVSVERSNRNAGIIRHNLESCALPRDQHEMRVQDVFTAIGQLVIAKEQFDLIVADTPFGEKYVGRRSDSFSQKLLDDARLPSLLAAGGSLLLGHARRDNLSLPPQWQEVKTLKHGDSVFSILNLVSTS